MDSTAYTLHRYRTAKNASERKGWLDFIERYEKDLYEQLKGEEKNG